MVLSGAQTTGGEYIKLQEEIARLGIPVVYARQGEEIEFEGAKIDILWPDLSYKIGQELPDNKLNDVSIVAWLNFQDLDVLFTGDISAKLEKQLAGILPDIDVLKVPHHGSKYSSTVEFLSALKPELAVIDTGKNSYGHPTIETMERLGQVGAQVLRTDLDGTIGIIWQKGEWRIKP